jgi:hypothetical protein
MSLGSWILKAMRGSIRISVATEKKLGTTQSSASNSFPRQQIRYGNRHTVYTVRIGICLVQETWLTGDGYKEIIGIRILHHGPATRTSDFVVSSHFSSRRSMLASCIKRDSFVAGQGPKVASSTTARQRTPRQSSIIL